MKTVVITGCNRGIGLGLVKHIASKCKLEHIIATCRDIEKATDLCDVQKEHQNVHILQAEMKDHGSIEALAKAVSDIVGDKGVNVLINNAGISTKFTRINLVKAEQLIEHYQVNTIGPIMMVKAFLPLLKKAVKKNADQPVGVSKAVIINMSTILGSIAENNQGGYYPYRTSKAALNAATKSMSIDLKDDKIAVISLHPGWVKTDLGGPHAPLDVETSVSGMIEFLYNITEKHNGGFYDYTGKQVLW